MNKTVVVVPSYNARRGIVKVISGILKFLPKAQVIVVDDNSPDNTADILQKAFKDDKRLKLIVREKKLGRGSAVLRGFKEGIKDKEVEFFIEMDADLSHNPAELPRLFKKAQGKDIIICSRYLPESKIIGWGIKRKVFSKIANFWARMILCIPITDYTNGYRCYKRKVIEAIIQHRIKSRGFSVLSEMVYYAYKRNFSFGEIGTIFTHNKDFGSNFNIDEVKEAFFTILRLRFFSNNNVR